MGTPFRWLLASTTSGALADGIATAALPLVLIGATEDPFLIALLPVAMGLPWLLFSLHAGVLVDRYDRRTVLWVADASRAVLVVLLVALIISDAAGVAFVLSIAFLEGVATVAFRAASPALLPALVAPDDLTRANGHIQTGSVMTGSFLGPALGSVLYPLASAVPFLARSTALLASVVCLRKLPSPEAEAVPAEDRDIGVRTVRADIGEGLRVALTDRVLRSLAVSTFLLASSTGMLQAVLVVHVVDVLRAPPLVYGILFSVFAIGSVIGAWLAAPFRHRLGSRACLMAAAGVGAAGLLLIASARDVYLAAGGMVLLGIGTMIYNVAAVTLRQERTSHDLLGRVSSLFNLVGVGAVPVAALIAGTIASTLSTAAALTSAAATCLGGLLWLTFDLRTDELAVNGAPTETGRRAR
ncbi:MFS transporter [Nocardioides insulae]|uniref:MFS transporter n=1 Tax=Nocardioides insulae TaxID=394734 RepID=UPI00040FF530|nr:MFS transporter [Nocardioides insulae]